MQNQITPPPDRLVLLTTIVGRFGYLDAKHFRAVIAPRLRLRTVQQGKRWFAWESEVERTLATLS